MRGVASAAVCDAYDGDDILADAHSGSAPDQEWASAEPVDGPECDRCCDNVDWIM